MKKVVRILLFALVLMMYAFSASAEETSGTCGAEGDNLAWTLRDGTLTITGEGAMKDLTYESDAPWYASRNAIEKVVLEDGVTRVGKYAFYGYTAIAEAVIPDSVESFGFRAFAGCRGLKEIVLPENVFLDSYAFAGCHGLTELTVPDGLVTESAAFENCSGLTDVTFCGSAELDYQAFMDCYKLERVHAESMEQWLSIKFLASYSNPLVYADSLYIGGERVERVVIPEGIEEIGHMAFRGANEITSVVIPSGVQSIGSCAFWGCENLAEVNFPEGLKTVGNGAFYECAKLERVILPDGVTSIGDAFRSCTSLKEIVMPDSVTELGEGAFYNCSSLESVKLPAGVTVIGPELFKLCTNLKEIELPPVVTSMGYGAFSHCKSLTSFDIPEGIELLEEGLFSACTALERVSIPEGVVIIGTSFSGCSALRSIIIPDSVKIVDYGAFSSCSALKHIWFVGRDMPKMYDAVFYGVDATYYCLKDTGVHQWMKDEYVDYVFIDDLEQPWAMDMPSRCDLEPGGTFDLNLLCFPDEDAKVWWRSTAPEVASVEDGVITAGNPGAAVVIASCGSKQATCTVMVTAPVRCVMPDGLTAVAEEAFAGSSVAEVILPEGCAVIGSRAFADCGQLQRIEIPCGEIFIAEDAFDGCGSVVFVCAPDSAAAAYAQAHGFDTEGIGSA